MKQEKIIARKRKVAIKVNRYTFIMNYLGGTYISQVEFEDEFSAMKVWLQRLETTKIKGFNLADKKRVLSNNFEGDFPIPITDIKNVWFFMFETKRGYGHVNIVKS